MHEFIKAVDQPVAADHVEALVARYGLRKYAGDDHSDEGLPREYYLESKSSGVLIRYYDARLVKTVYLYSGEQEGFSQFPGALIEGLTFRSKRNDVVRALGKPSRTAPALKVPILGSHGGWDRFDKVGYSIHFEYSARTNTVARITIMATCDPRVELSR